MRRAGTIFETRANAIFAVLVALCQIVCITLPPPVSAEDTPSLKGVLQIIKDSQEQSDSQKEKDPEEDEALSQIQTLVNSTSTAAEAKECIEQIWNTWDATQPHISRGLTTPTAATATPSLTATSTTAPASLKGHVINIGQHGRLCSTGAMGTTAQDIADTFETMEKVQSEWIAGSQTKSPTRDIVLYVHGGMVPERQGLDFAQKNISWWQQNNVYPVYFVWHTGLSEVLSQKVSNPKVVSRGLFDLSSLIEASARKLIKPFWNEIKTNAMSASAAIERPLDWSNPQSISTDLPGGSAFVDRLSLYVKKHPSQVRVHLVGHSAGSIFCAGLVQRLTQYHIPINSVSLMAPAIRVDDFQAYILPLVRSHAINKFTVFLLPDSLEQADAVGIKGIGYDHSILYLVSHALEGCGDENRNEVPLLGMAKFYGQKLDPISPATLQDAITKGAGNVVIAGQSTGALKTAAVHHTDFSTDKNTLNSLLTLIRNSNDSSTASK